MGNEKPGRFWLFAILLLLFALVVGGFIIWLRYKPGKPIEISLHQASNHSGIIYLSGAVANPGLYPFSPADTIESLLNAAGGPINTANFSNVRLDFVPDGTAGPQKIDINRADTWLLEALPGVGQTLAQRIIDYRELNGLFRSTSELLQVNGMGNKTYQQIESLITIGE